MRIITRAWWAFCVLPAMLALATTGQEAQTIASNLDTPVGSGGVAGIDNWFAQAFQTPADTGYALTRVVLKLARQQVHQGAFTASLWSATAEEQPGTQLLTITSGTEVSSLTNTFISSVFDVATPIALSPNTSYWVVLSASAASTNSGLLWGDSASFESNSSTVPGQIGGWSRSLDQGETWDAVELGFPFEMAVFGTPQPVIGPSAPQMLNPRYSRDGFSVSLRTAVGKNYVLEYSRELNQPWSPLSTVSGNGDVQTFNDRSAAGTEGYYRVRLL